MKYGKFHLHFYISLKRFNQPTSSTKMPRKSNNIKSQNGRLLALTSSKLLSQFHRNGKIYWFLSAENWLENIIVWFVSFSLSVCEWIDYVVSLRGKHSIWLSDTSWLDWRCLIFNYETNLKATVLYNQKILNSAAQDHHISLHPKSVCTKVKSIFR